MELASVLAAWGALALGIVNAVTGWRRSRLQVRVELLQSSIVGRDVDADVAAIRVTNLGPTVGVDTVWLQWADVTPEPSWQTVSLDSVVRRATGQAADIDGAIGGLHDVTTLTTGASMTESEIMMTSDQHAVGLAGLFRACARLTNGKTLSSPLVPMSLMHTSDLPKLYAE